MEIKNLLFIFLLFGHFTKANSGIEEQRKYIINPDQLSSEKIKLVAPFVFHSHSQYITYDIYFDTPDWKIKHSSHSFRLRRVEKKKGTWEYSVQMKSEMAQVGQIRMEIEYKDLVPQKVGDESLTQLIDQFITDESARGSLGEKLSRWMTRKKESSLAPFQKLESLSIDASKLRPVIWGHSVRQRYHVYTEKGSSLARAYFVKSSEKNIFLVPEFFKTHPHYIWLMEASSDRASFMDLLGSKKDAWQINELEIENKFRPRKLGTILLNELELKMAKVWNTTIGKESKYLSSSNHFHGAPNK